MLIAISLGKKKQNQNVHVNDSLDYGQHVLDISFRATKTFSFLRRNVFLAPAKTEEAAYKSYEDCCARLTCMRWRNISHIDVVLDMNCSGQQWKSLVGASFSGFLP